MGATYGTGVPLCDLQAQFQELQGQIEEAVSRVLASGQLILGPEVAAQAFCAGYQGKRAGTLGAIGCFSFYPSKILAAYGDAGMAVTNDPEWAARMAALRVHGMEVKYEHKYMGWNARLDALQAALLRVKLPYVDGWIDARQQAATRYDVLIDELQLASFLQRPAILPQRRHVFNQYV